MKLKIHPLFWFFLLLYVALGAFTKIGLILFSLFLHEILHLLVYKKLFKKKAALTLLPFGGVIETLEPVEFFPGRELLVAAAGPLANLALVFFALGLLNNGIYNTNITFLLDFNFIMAVFNLLPVLPLDGGRMLRAIFTLFFSLKNATKIVANLSVLTAILMVALGCYGFLSGLTGVDLVVLSGFLIFLAVKEKRKNSFFFLQNLTAKEKILTDQQVLLSRVLTVNQETTFKEVIEKFLPNHYQYVVVVGPEQNRLGIFSEREIMDGVVKHGLFKPVKELLFKS